MATTVDPEGDAVRPGRCLRVRLLLVDVLAPPFPLAPIIGPAG
jgi:hypothetical protein